MFARALEGLVCWTGTFGGDAGANGHEILVCRRIGVAAVANLNAGGVN
jgi:hypothetical protein